MRTCLFKNRMCVMTCEIRIPAIRLCVKFVSDFKSLKIQAYKQDHLALGKIIMKYPISDL